jgi:hypothetical protein
MSRKSPPPNEDETLDPGVEVPAENKGPGKADLETLTMMRIHRLLLKLPDDGTRSRVIAYLHDRHVLSKKSILSGKELTHE